MGTNVAVERLRSFRSVKVVRAGKVTAAEVVDRGGDRDLVLDSGEEVRVTWDWFSKRVGQVEVVGGYFVEYADGYTSWSPAEAFEEGYVELERFYAGVARAAHEANRILCSLLGDESQAVWEEAPEWQKISSVAGVKAVAANPQIKAEDLHASWLALKEKEGWVWGPIKDPGKREHPCMVPYEELPAGQRLKDALFRVVVRAGLGL